MSVLGSVGREWDRHCRRMRPDEAGALWSLVSMGCGSRVPGCVVARPEVFATVWNMGDGAEAVELLGRLRERGAVTVSSNSYTGALTVTVGMFADGWERARSRERGRVKAYHGKK